MSRADTRDGRDDELAPALASLPLFDFMPDETRQLVSRTFVPASYPFGAEIVREGDESDAFFVIVSGRARVLKRGVDGTEVSLRILTAGDSFGETGLVDGGVRNATVRATSTVEALRLDRSVFRALLGTHPELLDHFGLHVKRNELFNFLRVDSAFSRLPPEALGTLLADLVPVELDPGETVVRAGDPGDSMFVVEEGRLRAYREEDGRRATTGFYRAGDFFGESALFTGGARVATVECVTGCRLLQLTEATFRRLLDECAEFREAIEERVAQYDYRRVARVPLDFAQEILPADVGAFEAAVDADATFRDPESLLDAQVEGAPSEEWVPQPPPRRRRLARRFPHVWQIDEMDCGAACVAMVCRHFGRAASLSHIRELVSTGTDGTSLIGISHGAREVGLEARSVKASLSALDGLPLPAIVHWEGNHWVVLYDVGEDEVRVADPAVGLRRLPRDELEEKWTGYAVLLRNTPRLEHAPTASTSVGWVWPFLRPVRGTLAKATLLALLAAAVQMALPVFTQVVVDEVIVADDPGLLSVVVLALAGVLAVTVGAMVLQRYILSRAAIRIDGETLDFLTGKLLALPMRYFNARRAGDIQRRLAGIRQLREFATQHGVMALTASAQLVAAVVLMFVYSWILALVFLATVPAYAGLMRFSARRLRPLFDNLEESFARYQSRQIDAVKGIETVKAMGAEPGLRRLLNEQFDGLARQLFRADFTVTLYAGFVQLLTFVSLALFLWVGAIQVIEGRLTLGGLVAFNSLVVLANQPLALLLSAWDDLQLKSVLVARLNDVLDQEPEQGRDRAHLRPVPSLEGRVSFRNVGFHYHGPVPTPILEDITFDVPPGCRVAIVGRSGSGKTTLVKCLAGLLEPTSGAILYDGVDLRTLDYRQLRRQIGFVLQESHLFDDTIARNIAFGEEEPDFGRVAWAARLANAHEFVERLPLGYETRVGETGILLSGGQRQRLAIARAVYHRPPVLIFDEATSALDSESERAIRESMDELFEGRTSFVIAHRLSTIRDADTILVLERGRLVEQGTHEELLARQGLYYYLSSQQLEV